MGALAALTGILRGLVAALAALSLTGCLASGPPTGPFGSVWPGLREQADSLFALGECRLAGARVAQAADCVRSPYASAWQVLDRQDAEREYRRIARLPLAQQAALVRAASEYRAAQRASQQDSLANGESLARQAYETRLRWLGPDAVATARAGLGLADLAFRLARVREADSLAESSERCLVRAFGEDHPDVAVARAIRGRGLKNYTGAIARPQILELYGNALRIRAHTLGPSALEIAGSYHEIGNLERLSGHTVAALDCFRMALTARRAALGPMHDDVAATLSAMAVLEASRGSWQTAETLAAGALAASPPMPVTPPMSRAFRLGVLGQVLRHNGHDRQALPYIEEAIALNETAWSLSPRDEGSTIQSGLGLHADLALVLARLGQPADAFEALEGGSSRTLIERSTGSPPRSPAERLRRVQQALPADAALVTWVRTGFTLLGGDEPAWACVVRASGPPHWLRLERSELRLARAVPLRNAYFNELRSAARWPVRLPEDAREQRLASAMGAAWFGPLEPWLQGVKQLVVFSPELFAGGSLAALADSSGHWLLDRFSISYASSATLYAMAREHHREWPRSASALVVGDPGYRQGTGRCWARLAGSRDEITAVSSAVPATHVLFGAAASARGLTRLVGTGEMSRFRLLHLATHTEIDAAHILESDIVLAPDQVGAQDSRVSARQIIDTWRLDADLVCLTGCRSATGPAAAGQGWFGFQQAFFRAGARSVLVSLWPVDDAATALLVKEFYARLSVGATMGSRSEALRGAQRAVREWCNAAGEHPYGHPAYWAGFALIGDPG